MENIQQLLQNQQFTLFSSILMVVYICTSYKLKTNQTLYCMLLFAVVYYIIPLNKILGLFASLTLLTHIQCLSKK